MSKVTFEIPAPVVRAASLFLANKFEKRKYLRHIAVADNGSGPSVYATNGHILFKWPLRDDAHKGFLFLRKNAIFIPADVVQPVRETASCKFEVDLENSPAKITMRYGDDICKIYETLTVQRAPNYDNSIPDYKAEPGGVDAIVYNPRYLSDIDNAFRLLDRNALMKVFLTGSIRATVIRAVRGDDLIERATIVLMPVKNA